MLLALLLTACAPKLPFEIPVTATLDGAPVVCGAPMALGSSTAKITDARLFVSEPTLLTADGEELAIQLEADGVWQTEDAALLDFEDGCDNGTAGTNMSLRGLAPEGDYVGLKLTVGLPLDLNHANPALAEAPLSTTSMHWTWAAGYKFLRLDYSRTQDFSAEVDATTHIGSTDCQGTVGDITGCDRPNRAYAQVELDPFDAALQLELAELIPPEGCMATTLESACAEVFDALGLDQASGAATGPARALTAAP